MHIFGERLTWRVLGQACIALLIIFLLFLFLG
jgi:hypothetical protein